MNKIFRLLAVLAVLTATVLVLDQVAQARVGGGRSSGSRGTRSYSRPVAPPSQTSPSPAYNPSRPSTPLTTPAQQPSRGMFGNFGSSLLGGIAGGMLGGMLFRSLGFGGGYGGGGGGIGLFEILLLAGIGYMIYRFVKKKREAEGSYDQQGRVIQLNDHQNQSQYQGQAQGVDYEPARDELGEGLSYIRQMDPGFDEKRFNDTVMDLFFKVQGAWMNRELSPVAGILTEEMRSVIQRDIDTLVQEKKVNRLENIAVRSVEISEAWQESGKDFITALIYANLLDYTTDDTTGAVIAGSKTEPVKFEEFWTFTRPVGNNPWKLSGIDQK